MIEKTTSFKTSDGAIHATVELAQRHELEQFLVKSGVANEGLEKDIASNIIEQKDHIVDILTMKASSHPKARKANGATRKPRAAKQLEPVMNAV